MPKFAVYYTTEVEWCVIVEADDESHARDVWMDPAFWDSEPEAIHEDMMDTNVSVEEL